VANSELKTRIATPVDIAVAESSFCRDWRNRHFSLRVPRLHTGEHPDTCDLPSDIFLVKRNHLACNFSKGILDREMA
jgi:hypothetical protein